MSDDAEEGDSSIDSEATKTEPRGRSHSTARLDDGSDAAVHFRSSEATVSDSRHLGGERRRRPVVHGVLRSSSAARRGATTAGQRRRTSVQVQEPLPSVPTTGTTSQGVRLQPRADPGPFKAVQIPAAEPKIAGIGFDSNDSWYHPPPLRGHGIGRRRGRGKPRKKLPASQRGKRASTFHTSSSPLPRDGPANAEEGEIVPMQSLADWFAPST
jgi:hypothetical protein